MFHLVLMLVSILLQLFNCHHCGAVLFRWVPSTSLSDPANWQPIGSIPCADDNVRLDAEDKAVSAGQEGISVAHLDGSLRAHIVTLPSNGLLYFGPGLAELGTATRTPDWQCGMREHPKDTIFNPHHNSPNFFDAANWKILSENSAQMPSLLRLDAERVPSEEVASFLDRVLFPDEATSKVFIEVPARLNSLNISGQALSSRNLWHMLRTVEGQFRFQMGSRISAEIDSRGHFHLRRPLDTVFTVVGNDADDGIGQRQRALRAAFFGRPNSNFFEPQFSSLCAFVRCLPTEPYCAEPVRAIGQCCAQCGAMLRFRKNSLNFTLSRAIVDEFVRAQMAMPLGAGMSFVRIDRDDFHPFYQISVLSNHPAHFDEFAYCTILWSVFTMIKQRTINAHLSLEYQPGDSAEFFDINAKCSIQLGILHWKTVFKTIAFVAMVVILVGGVLHAHYRRSVRFRFFVNDFVSRQSHSMQQVSCQGEHVMIRSHTTVEENGDREGAQVQLVEFVNRAFLEAGKRTDKANEQIDGSAHKQSDR